MFSRIDRYVHVVCLPCFIFMAFGGLLMADRGHTPADMIIACLMFIIGVCGFFYNLSRL